MDIGHVVANRFVIEELVSEGGLGRIYRGWDLDREQLVAIKVLIDSSAENWPRFQREAELLAELDVPGLVGYVSHGELDGQPYIVMPWIAGTTVAQHLSRVGFDIAGAVALVRTLCTPLAELHARGFVHRDLKPENVMLASESAADAILIDLGLARGSSTAEPRLTATGVALGTPGYMAPEQIRGTHVDVRADIFALGCILFECCTGYATFAGENPLAVRMKILCGQPLRLRQLCPEAPVALDELVARMLAQDADRRPSGVEVLASELASLDDLPAGRKRPWHAERPTSTANMPVVSEATRVIVQQRARYHGVLLVHSQDAPDDATVRAALREHAASIERIDDGFVVVATGPQLAACAREIAAAAHSLRAHLASATIVVTAGSAPLDDIIDRCAVLVERVLRAAAVGRAERAVTLLDPNLAAVLDDSFAVELGPAGHALGPRRQ